MWLLPMLVVAAGAVSPPLERPLPGRHDAQLCVRVQTQAPNCGPVTVQADAEGSLAVQVHDLRYLLVFHDPGALLVVTLHGNMIVSEFVSTYRWAGPQLLYADPARATQYELTFTPTPRASTP